MWIQGALVNSCVTSHYSNFSLGSIIFTSAQNHWDAHAFSIQKIILTILFCNKHTKCKQGFVRKKKKNKSNKAILLKVFHVRSQLYCCFQGRSAPGLTISGIVHVQMATHIKSVEGSESWCSTHLWTPHEWSTLGLQLGRVFWVVLEETKGNSIESNRKEYVRKFSLFIIPVMVVSAAFAEVLFCNGLCTHTVTWLFELGQTTRAKGGIRTWSALSKLSEHSVGKLINDQARLLRVADVSTVFARLLRTRQLLFLLDSKMKEQLSKL